MYEIVNGWFKQSHKIASPNYNLRPKGIEIDAIIIHSISMPPACYEGDDISQFGKRIHFMIQFEECRFLLIY